MPLEFPLKYPNPQSRAMGRIAQFEVVLFTAGPAALAALGVITWGSLWMVPYMWVLFAIFFVRFGWMKGTALIDIDGVSVKSRIGRQSYPWRDIQAVELTTLRERDRWTRLWTRAYGGSLDEPLVQLRLRKLPRVALFHLGWGQRSGTDVFGIPVPAGKRVIIPVRDTDEFLKTAADFVAIKGISAPPASAIE